MSEYIIALVGVPIALAAGIWVGLKVKPWFWRRFDA